MRSAAAAEAEHSDRELEGKVTVFSEAYKDVRTKSYESVNRLIDDIDRIKRERQGTITRMLRDAKVRLILAVIAAAAVLLCSAAITR